jgi:PKD repeat protein
MKKILLSLSLLIGLGASAQMHSCAEHTMTQKWLDANPTIKAQYQQSVEDFNNEVRNFEQSNSRARGVVYTIPIVFHIIHDYGASNISDDQIMDALAILNRDYRLQNSDANAVVATFLGVPGDAEIEFALATKKNNGQCFSGITRTVSSYTSGNENQQVSVVTNAHGNFPGNKYLNIFVVEEASGAAGYTYQPSPWSGADMSDGIYITHQYLGSIGTGNTGRSRALTHEVGHWLKLSHTWGGTNNPGVGCGDDNVSDTPETIGSNLVCDLTATTCDGNLDNVENYMEYSYCSKMFTPGQITRMRTALNSTQGGRNNLWTPSNLAITGADGVNDFCSADFTVERNYVCLNGTLQFEDESFNTVTNWSWSSPGGNANNASIADPIFTFTTAGVQSVTLTSGDGGTTDNEVKSNYIHVFPATAGTFPYSEDFESFSSLNEQGIVSGYESHPYSWDLYTGVGSSGTKCAKFNAFGCPYGLLEREFVSYPIDLSGATAGDIEISFKTVYKKTDNIVGSEKLFVYFSSDCGQTWALGRQWFHTQLEQGTSNFAYNPSTAGEYMLNSHTIPDNYKVSSFMYKFVWKNSGGNNIFVDDINIDYVGGVGIEEQELEQLSVYPNPFNDNITIKSGTSLSNSTIELFDVRGKLVKTYKRDLIGNTVINTSDMKQGMYLLKVRNNGYSKTFRIVK